jgi:hypothetical protein
MSPGRNHSTREVTEDAEREEKAQVGPRKAILLARTVEGELAPLALDQELQRGAGFRLPGDLWRKFLRSSLVSG